MDTNHKGAIALCKVLLVATEKHITCSKPLTDHNRYDLVIDDGQLKRAQIKYANGTTRSKGVVRASLDKNGKVYTATDVDIMLVYLPCIDKICCFGPEVFGGKKNLYIRYQDAKNKQRGGCLFAEDHLW